MKMKKLFLCVALIATMGISLIGCGNTVETLEFNYVSEYTKDGISYLTDQENVFKKVDYSNLMKLLDNDDTYVIYFGGKWCPYCRVSIKYINQIAKEKGIETVYNFDTRLDNETKATDIRACFTEETKKMYADMIYKLGYVNPNGTVINENEQKSAEEKLTEPANILSASGCAIPRLSAPTLMVVKNGRCIGFTTVCYRTLEEINIETEKLLTDDIARVINLAIN